MSNVSCPMSNVLVEPPDDALDSPASRCKCCQLWEKEIVLAGNEACPVHRCSSGFDGLSGTFANQSGGSAESQSNDVEYLLRRLSQQPREGRRPRAGRSGPPGCSG